MALKRFGLFSIKKFTDIIYKLGDDGIISVDEDLIFWLIYK